MGVPELPSFIGLSPPPFLWNDTIEGSDFVDRVTAAYDEVVHWKRNLFVVPFGKVGKEFVLEFTPVSFLWGEDIPGVYCTQSSNAFLYLVTSEAPSHSFFQGLYKLFTTSSASVETRKY